MLRSLVGSEMCIRDRALIKNEFLAFKSKNLGKYYKISFVIRAILHWKVLFYLQFNHICRSWTIIEKCLCTFVPPGIPIPNHVTITQPIPGSPTISYQSDYWCMHCHLCLEPKNLLAWALAIIEFPVLSFHLLKSGLNYFSSL